MTNIWLEAFLGKTGKYIIIFLSRYYYFIIPVIIIYGIFLTLSSYNLKRIEKKVNLEIFNQAKNIIEKNPEIGYIDLEDRIKIPWEKIIKTCSFFPYIPREADLWVSKNSLFNVKKLIMNDNKKIRTVLERSGINNFREKSNIRKNLYMEYIHRITSKKED